MSAAAVAGAAATLTDASEVFAEPVADRHTTAIAALIDPAFLGEAGWDSGSLPAVDASLAGPPDLSCRGLLDHRGGSVPDLRVLPSSAHRARADRRRDRRVASTPPIWLDNAG